ncbi:hypothetical protein ACFST9_00095 [Hymenobacter monticola]|uniref:Uncharacterized protein n=1 Tax=Hymenobacter monticola TaxID=1705399 RepID=A0ABY4BCZ0_9BACT|nr:hypothetical protein [Hymenobacter monticola]UOE36759.1 hypothetical protein MTP16_25515 [Hymenobacter monticola]
MKKTQKIRLVIEADVAQDTEFTPEVVQRIWGKYGNFKDFIKDEYWQENIRQEQVLLDILLADPKKYHLLLLGALQHQLDDSGTAFFQLAGYDTGSKPAHEFDPLEDVVDTLPPATAAYFQRMKQEGIFSERTELITFSTDVTITSIQVEEVN